MAELHPLGYEGQEPALRVMAMPKDTNAAGDIFGGWIMAQVDIAGAIVAAQWAKSRVATVAVNEFVFKQPVYVGDLISCYGEIVKVGRTSITVRIEVCAQRNRYAPECLKVTEATAVYVALDENGNPHEVPQATD